MNYRNISYFKFSKKFHYGVSVVIHTYNSENDILCLLKQVSREKINEIIISDQGSSDKTIQICKKFTNKIIKSKHHVGKKRALESYFACRYKYIFAIETDQRINRGLVKQLIYEINKTNSYIVFSPLEIINPKNYWEKGMKLIYDKIKKKEKYFSTPFLSYTEFLLNLYSSKSISEGASIDSSLLDEVKEKKINIKACNKISFQEEKLTLKKIFTKFFWYGKGDYIFFSHNFLRWSFRRKIKSLSHVFLNYFISLPFFCFKKRQAKIIPFCYFVGIVRYFGFIYFFIRKKF